jgi:pimeloyl-ACP methyl ester carboxylesterase
MALLGARLRDAGFHTVNVGYPSGGKTIEELVSELGSRVQECCAAAPDVHFVTHSMGGILVRLYLAEHSPEHAGRVVMLSPPSQGSEVVDALLDSPLRRLFLGPAGSQLGTDSLSVPSRLGPAEFELGIITGSRTLNPLTSWLIPGPDDGKVGVDRARVEGAAFLVVPHTHTFIMNTRVVAEECEHFLRTGHFSRGGPRAPIPADSARSMSSSAA